MSRHPLARFLLGAALVAALVSCGSDPGPSDQAAESSAAEGQVAGPEGVAGDASAGGSTDSTPGSTGTPADDATPGATTAAEASAGEGPASTSAQTTAPGRAPAPRPPAPKPGPATGSGESPGGKAPGAPYDINAFDRIQGTTLTTLDEEIAARCGSPSGAPNCLTVDEQPATAPQELRDACRLPTFQYDPPAKYAEGDTGKLQRGTVVHVQVECPQPLDSAAGSTLAEVDAAIAARCGFGEGAECTLVVSPEVPDDVDRASCTVTSVSYAPEPVEAGPLGTVMDVGTVVTVEISCPTPGP